MSDPFNKIWVLPKSSLALSWLTFNINNTEAYLLAMAQLPSSILYDACLWRSV